MSDHNNTNTLFSLQHDAQDENSKNSKTVQVQQIIIENKYPHIYCDIPMKNSIPVGSVEFCQPNSPPDPYPDFVQPYLHRRFWKGEPDASNPTFIQPADKYRSFKGCKFDVCNPPIVQPPYWCSEFIEFINKWRYYIIHGKVVKIVKTGGSAIQDVVFNGTCFESPPIPNLDCIDIPTTFCGTIDVGEFFQDDGITCAVIKCQPYLFC
jgi:hypothetical protein